MWPWRPLLIALCLICLGARADGYQYWNNIRHSALLPDTTIVIRTENPSGSGIENYLLYASGGVLEQVMIPILDGPSTVSATVPGPTLATRYCGFRLLQGGEIDFLPVRIADGESPEPQDLTRLAEDAIGDHLYSYINLDLVDCRVSFSGDRLFAALTNAGGGFPVSSGLTFFGYLLGIANPALSDPDTVLALMQTFNQPGIITPGLYRVMGTGMSDLVKIGEVEIQEFPAANTLIISCLLSDLLADPYFTSWYNPADPTLGVAGFTQRITLLGGAKEADRTPGGRCYLRALSVDPAANQVPQISNLTIQGTGPEAFAQIDYWDANGDCPVVARMVFDDTLSLPMYPLTLDYGSTVVYRTDAGVPPLADDSWTEAVVRFSDNLADTVEYTCPTNGVDDDPSWEGATGLRVSIAPNPFTTTTFIDFTLPVRGSIRAEIYDVGGRLVRTLVNCHLEPGTYSEKWDGRDGQGQPVPSGIYFCRFISGREASIAKVVVLR